MLPMVPEVAPVCGLNSLHKKDGRLTRADFPKCEWLVIDRDKNDPSGKGQAHDLKEYGVY